MACTLTRPIRELTAATHQIAGGDLGVQVPVHTHDELGELALSFNTMSADLEQASRLRRQMTADIAHDLRTPLSVILGYTEALSDGKLQATPKIATTLHREAQQLNHLIDDLRTLSLADAGELPLHRGPVAPAALLERAASSYRMQAEQQEIAVVIDTGTNLPRVNVDSQRMAQVLGNLVSNALRHTPAGGAVTLSARATAADVQLQVHDTGSGIAAGDLPHVFARSIAAIAPARTTVSPDSASPSPNPSSKPTAAQSKPPAHLAKAPPSPSVCPPSPQTICSSGPCPEIRPGAGNPLRRGTPFSPVCPICLRSVYWTSDNFDPQPSNLQRGFPRVTDYRIDHNENDSRFETTVDGHTAKLLYRAKMAASSSQHTDTARRRGPRHRKRTGARRPGLRGEQSLTVVPQCPFVRTYIERHPEYQSLTA